MDRFDEMRGKSGSGGGSNAPSIILPDGGTMTGIMITQKPYKLDYNEGDSIDITGLQVIGVYDNDSTMDITNYCNVVIDDPLTVYTTTVIVKFDEFEASYLINVYAKPLPIPSSALYLLHFNGNGTNVVDTNNNMSTTNMGYTTGKFGQACKGISRMNGITNKLASIETILKNGGYNYTFSFWIKYTSTYDQVNYNHQFCWGDSGYYDDYGIWVDYYDSSRKLRLWTRSIYIDYTLETSILNTWTHIAFTIDSSTNVTFFVNGKKVGTKSFRSSGASIAYRAVSWSVPIDELLITNDILYTSDFEPPANEYGGERVLQKIYVEEQPKSIYQSGEYFDLNTGKIMAVYSEGSIIDVTSDCVVLETEPITSTDRFRTVSYTYGGVTKKIYINVGAYTVEKEPDLSATKLLMPFDGSSQDVAMNFPITVHGNDTYSSLEQGKFGQARYFNGSTDYISMPYTQDINIDTGDFTIAFWVDLIYKTENDNTIFVATGDSGQVGLRTGVWSNGGFFVNWNKDNTTTTFELVTAGSYILKEKWSHVAIVRKGNIISTYIDGIKIGSVTHEGQFYSGTEFKIGARHNQNGVAENLLHGYIDDLIVTKSALWDGEFTPPEKPFSSIS